LTPKFACGSSEKLEISKFGFSSQSGGAGIVVAADAEEDSELAEPESLDTG
jgi:hypothetical protein